TEPAALDQARIAERIRAHFVSAHPVAAADLGLDASLLEDVLVDSLAIVSTIAFLEDTFGIRVRRADINARVFGSLRTLSEYVTAQLD
ncbi:MAG: acyl carrier protein, partial [Planctomycetota bacterium]